MAAAALMDPARHAGKTYRPGPEAPRCGRHGPSDRHCSGALGQSAADPDLALHEVGSASGLPDRLDERRSLLHRRSPAGCLRARRSTTDVLEVTSRPAEDFETIARRYAALPRNQRTAANRFRQLGEFMIAPLRRGFDFQAYDRELRRPFPSQPQFARSRRFGSASTPQSDT